MQVTGKFSAVVDKVKANGPRALYNGSLAAASATFVGHYPWFATYNFLSEKIPKQDTQLAELGRRAVLGFCSSAVSDTCSNSIRVLKVYKQSHPEQLAYPEVLKRVIAESGVSGLMFRGLETKIFANGLQGILFSILWKQFEGTIINVVFALVDALLTSLDGGSRCRSIHSFILTHSLTRPFLLLRRNSFWKEEINTPYLAGMLSCSQHFPHLY